MPDFESEWRIDTSGEFRISLGNNIQLTNKLNAFAEFEYDTGTNVEWLAGLNYTVLKNLGLVTQYHADFGMGAGVRLSF